MHMVVQRNLDKFKWPITFKNKSEINSEEETFG